MNGDANDRQRLRSPSACLLIGTILAGLTFLAVGAVSPYAMFTVLRDFLRAAMILLPPALCGLWLIAVLRLDKLPLRWHLILGSALGLGFFSFLVFVFGLIGLLQRPLWIGLLVLMAVAGAIRCRWLYDRRHGSTTRDIHTPAQSRWWTSLWLLAAPFAVLALLAASHAPGLIRQEEGFAYDVLSYHLELPKEYYQAGRIDYMPHNVYANFPANVEMLYLAAMVVHGDVPDIGTTANMIHLLLAVLTVASAWAAGREWSSASGILGGVIVATTGWLTYLSGLAYVEHGMLFFGLTGTAMVLRTLRERETDSGPSAAPRKIGRLSSPLTKGGLRGVLRLSNNLPQPLLGKEGGRRSNDLLGNGTYIGTESNARELLLAGLIIGFACGCKYTAVALIAAPVWLVIALNFNKSIKQRLADVVVFSAATLATLSPWLIRNVVTTGNPVFPLANSLFHASPPGWGEQETLRWDRAHGLEQAHRDPIARLGAAWNRTMGDRHQRFGPAIVLIAIVGLIGLRWRRTEWALCLILFVQLAMWLLATHLFARFAVVLLIPLALLCARAVARSESRGRTGIIVGLLVVGSAWNLALALRLHRQESSGGAPASLIYDGELPGFEYFRVVNHELPDDSKILLVGDAKAFYFQRNTDYCVTFNRNPFFEAVRDAGSAKELIEWLRRKGYSHMLVNWSEAERLASSYGFSPTMDTKKLRHVFDELETAGVRLAGAFPHPRTGGRYVDLYELPK